MTFRYRYSIYAGISKGTLAGVLASMLMVLVFMVNSEAAAALRMATTTSTQNSGLLNELLLRFREATGIDIHVIAVGSGRALRLGENGDVDLILVHAPEAEQQFVENGYGVNRHEVMYNDFVLLGPRSDPAAVATAETVLDALKFIALAKTTFISRGDGSGTHLKELELWQAAEVTPSGQWYMEIGQGMEQALIMAHEKGSYILTDRGTFLAVKQRLDLYCLREGDEILYNPYGVIAVNPKRHSHVQYREALQFIRWLTGVQGKRWINRFKVDGKQLFYAIEDAGS